jgi:Na+/glutamate symporter
MVAFAAMIGASIQEIVTLRFVEVFPNFQNPLCMGGVLMGSIAMKVLVKMERIFVNVFKAVTPSRSVVMACASIPRQIRTFVGQRGIA